MFVGHFAVGFASAGAAGLTWRVDGGAYPARSLWPIFLALGWEQARIDPGNTAVTPLDFVSYPISHSLLTACGWGVLFALVYWLVSHYVRGAVVIALGVISHWVLDFVTPGPICRSIQAAREWGWDSGTRMRVHWPSSWRCTPRESGSMFP